MIQIHVAVPSQVVGTIVGDEGSTIAQLSAESGSRMSASSGSDGQQYIVIVGGLHAACMAQQLLDRMVQQASTEMGLEHEVNVTAVFWVPMAASGAIIGKAGANLASIREQAGVQVTFCREEVRGMRACSIAGLLDNVLQAETLMVNLLEERELAQAAKRPGEFEDGMGADPKRSRTMGGGISGPDPFLDFQDGWQDPQEDSSWQDGAIMPFAGTPQPQQRSQQPDYRTIGRFQAGDAEQPGQAGQAGQTKFLVPARSAGLVIGKQGSGLAKIRQESGAKLELLQAAKAPHFPEDRVVIVQGAHENRIQAVNAVLQTAFGGSDGQACLKMLVDKKAAGTIIGKQGATLKQLRQNSGVGCQVAKDEIFGERMITASGALSGILALAGAIMNLLD